MVAIEHRQKSSTAATATPTEIETEQTTATINIADVLSPTSSASSVSAASNTTTTTTSSIQQQQQQQQQPPQQHSEKEKQQTLEEKKQLVEEALKINQKLLIQKQSSKSDKMSSHLESPPPAAEIDTSEKEKEANTGSGAVSKSAVSQRNVDIKIAKKSNIDAATKELTKKVLKLDLTGKELEDLAIKSPKSPIARLPHQTSLTSSVDVEDRKTLREALYQGIFHRHRRTIFAVGSFLRMLRSRNSQYNTIRSSSEGEEVEEVAR